MQAAADANLGTMAAVLGLSDGQVQDTGPGGVWVANLNAPSHVVISGGVAEMALAVTTSQEAGAKPVLPLPVGGGFRSR